MCIFVYVTGSNHIIQTNDTRRHMIDKTFLQFKLFFSNKLQRLCLNTSIIQAIILLSSTTELWLILSN